MKTTKLLTLTLFISSALFIGCESTQTQGMEGFTMNGQKSSCEPMVKDKICTEVFTVQDRFAVECGEQGHEVIRCDCHEYLCKTKDGMPFNFEQ